MNSKQLTFLEGTPPTNLLPLARPGTNLTARDYVGEKIKGGMLSKCTFNGSSFYQTRFVGCDVKHSEFTECAFYEVEFYDTTLKSSDLVLSHVVSSTFTGCDFSNGEWRETRFEKVRFTNCNFDHTTMSLCSFIDCTFDSFSVASFSDVSASYNVFSRCVLPTSSPATLVLQNFGLLLDADSLSEQPLRMLSKLCLQSAAGRPNQLALVDLIIESLREVLGAPHRVSSVQVRFIKIILMALAYDSWMSTYAFQVIEKRINALIGVLNLTETALSDLAALVFAIRGILYDKALIYDNLQNSSLVELHGPFQATLTLPCQEDLEAPNAYVLLIISFLDLSEHDVDYHIYPGSAVVKLVINVSVPLLSFLVYTNSVLGEVSTALQTLNDIKMQWTRLSEQNVPYVSSHNSSHASTQELAIQSEEYTRMQMLMSPSGSQSIYLERTKKYAWSHEERALSLDLNEAYLSVELLEK